MKSYSSHSRRNLILLLKSTLVVLSLLALMGCSSGNDQPEASPSETVAELDQLKTENENLQTELDKAVADKEAAESKIKELEDELTAMQEAQAIPSPTVPVVNITPPERTPSELLVGQWFYQGFHEEGLFSFTQTLVFNTDGTGTMSRRYYIPKSEVEAVKSSPSALPDLDSSVKCSWSLNGDTVHIVLDNGEAADFTYSSAQQLLQMKDGNDKYGKETPSGMEQYVERALYAENLQVKEAAQMRRFLGMWYLDVLTWTFNEDGTGVIDMPELGDQPATQREFTYSVTDDSADATYLCLMLDWEDGDTSYFYPEFGTDGSMSLKGFNGSETMKLTRTFDIDNCPISEQIISAGIGVFSGSIFSDILGSE